MTFAANLKLSNLSDDVKNDRIENLIEELGLKKYSQRSRRKNKVIEIKWPTQVVYSNDVSLFFIDVWGPERRGQAVRNRKNFVFVFPNCKQ